MKSWRPAWKNTGRRRHILKPISLWCSMCWASPLHSGLSLFLSIYFVYRAFGLQGVSAMTILLLQAAISISVDMLPLPGGMGISEKLFLTILVPVFAGHLLLPGMILSRGIELLYGAAAQRSAYSVCPLRPKKETYCSTIKSQARGMVPWHPKV